MTLVCGIGCSYKPIPCPEGKNRVAGNNFFRNPLRESVGGADGIRTHDLLDAIEARSQLRHGPTDERTNINASIRMQGSSITGSLTNAHRNKIRRDRSDSLSGSSLNNSLNTRPIHLCLLL